MYHRHSGIWNDGPACFKVCLDCDKLRDDVDEGIYDDCERTAFGCLQESVIESRDKEFRQRFSAIKLKRQSNECT
jgi:hypothetical protein